jgi:rRNA small subunit pseudouridine methyltransferase Nep1
MMNCVVQLLHKLSIRSAESGDKLLKVIKNPITDHLPVGAKKILTSFSSTRLVRPRELVPEGDDPIVVIVGAMAHGKVRFGGQ